MTLGDLYAAQLHFLEANTLSGGTLSETHLGLAILSK